MRRGNRKTNEEFLNELENLYPNEYKVLEPYVKSSTKVKVEHMKCGFIYEVLPGNILKGRKCPKCQKRIKTKCTEFLSKEISEWGNNEYVLLSEYKNSRSKVRMLHSICGEIYFVTPNDFQQGKRCPKCFGAKKRSTNQYVLEVLDLVGNEYEVIGEYINSKTKIETKHTSCGSVYYVSPENFLRHGKRCPICKESKGEKSVRNALIKYGYNFTEQKTFSDLLGLGGRPLKFDFSVEDEKGKIIFLIEYDGEFHYKSKAHIGGQEALEKQQLHDSFKDEYCYIKGIPFLRIPFWKKDDIDTLISKIPYDTPISY